MEHKPANINECPISVKTRKHWRLPATIFCTKTNHFFS